MNPLVDKLLFAFVGLVLGYIAQQYRASRSEQSALINEHIRDIEKFAEAAQTYWLTAPSSPDGEAMLSAKVRSAHAVTTLPYERVATLCDHRSKRYRELASELFQTATGGNFEVISRGIDQPRAIDTMRIPAETVMLLRLARADLISLRRLFQWIWK